jgi:hypothetical protein
MDTGGFRLVTLTRKHTTQTREMLLVCERGDVV